MEDTSFAISYYNNHSPEFQKQGRFRVKASLKKNFQDYGTSENFGFFLPCQRWVF